jgi:hypothetical protein
MEMPPKRNGGPAFPRSGHESSYERYDTMQHAGMTLRDYFAAAALQGLLTDASLTVAIAVKHSVEAADELMAALHTPDCNPPKTE